jgi:asparagine synthetase B (glutamine-hydrolysing)
MSYTERVCLAALNPSRNTKVHRTAVAAGAFHPSHDGWTSPCDDFPDGAFCLVRTNEDTLQLVTDPTGSRTIWYLHDEERFIASTSQRAIVALSQSFHLNPQASAWMLSTGALGPGHSWDERIRMVPPNSIVSLDIHGWRLDESNRQYEHRVEERDEEYFAGQMRNAIEDVFSRVGGYSPDWLIPLSGGVDSRAIMLWLTDPRRFRYVTWGRDGASGNPKSDATIAARLADKYGLDHRYAPLSDNIDNPESFFAKFIAAGEGRISHISGYLDEFAFWENLHAENCSGVMRGDQVFGGRSLLRPIQVRALEGLCTLSEMPAPFGALGAHFPDQELPAHLDRRPGESLDTWRCRTELHFRAPVIRAALNELKFAYTDVASPLQFRPIVEVVVRMPDHLRTDKKLFASMVAKKEPEVPYATNMATPSATNVVMQQATNDFLMDGISTLDSEVYLPAEVLRQVREMNVVVKGRNGNGDLAGPKASFYRRVRNRFDKYFGGASVTAPQLLLRSYLAIATSRMFTNDAYFVAKIRQNAARDDGPVDIAAG